ncbi:MAG: high-potential iron-sulfur protein [Xanthobacteraceae bacterium]
MWCSAARRWGSAPSRPGPRRPARAQQKVSQADAKYQAQPKDGQQCDGCLQFQAPNACKLVDGNISPTGWCLLFAAKPK